jgi:hypothetical protein
MPAEQVGTGAGQGVSNPAAYIDHLNLTGQAWGYDFSEWAAERGHVNGDGIEDVAMILSCSGDDPGGSRCVGL